jgi:hypothetical protein
LICVGLALGVGGCDVDILPELGGGVEVEAEVPPCENRVRGAFVFQPGAALDLGGACAVDGSVAIQGAVTAEDLSPLSKVREIVGNLEVFGVEGDVLSPLKRLRTLTGRLQVLTNPGLTHLDALAGLQGAVGVISIRNNPLLTSIEGLRGITSCAGLIQLSSLGNLRSIEGLHRIVTTGELELGPLSIEEVDLPLLEGVGGDLTIEFISNLGHVSLPALMRTGHLTVRNNQTLAALDVPALTVVGGNLAVCENPLLPVDTVQKLQAQAQVSGVVPCP